MTQHSQNGEGVELLPCPNPWCDCPNELVIEPIVGTGGMHGVECGCGFNGPVLATADLAITAWNTRQSLTAREPATADVGRASQCLTPGCRYSTEIKTNYAHSSYGNARVGITALFPEWKGLAVKTSAQLKQIDEILHRHMELAIAEIGQYDLSLGGTIAKDWPSIALSRAAPSSGHAMAEGEAA